MDRTKVSQRGQVVIPKSIRERLGIERGQLLEVREVEGGILMSPLEPVRSPGASDWRGWGGVLKDSGALQDLEAEHRREIERGR